jgi:hypothetical protein
MNAHGSVSARGTLMAVAPLRIFLQSGMGGRGRSVAEVLIGSFVLMKKPRMKVALWNVSKCLAINGA